MVSIIVRERIDGWKRVLIAGIQAENNHGAQKMESFKEIMWILGKEYAMPIIVYADLNEEVGNMRY